MHLGSCSATACASSSCTRLCSRGSTLHHRVAAISPLSAWCLQGTCQPFFNPQAAGRTIILLSRGPAMSVSEQDN